MKNSFKYIAAFVAFSAAAIASELTANAQNLVDGTYIEDNGIAYAKFATLEDGTNNKYLIDLKTFVTGEVTQTFEVHPADIVLVLDVSGSMDDDISSTSSYEEATVNGLYGRDYSNNNPTEYYYKYNDNYYSVYIGRGGSSGNRRYYLFFRVGGQTYYINTSGQVVTNQPTNVNSQSTNLLASNVQLYTQVTTSITKMDALKTAVEAFIDQIAHNDLYEDDTDSKPRETALGNRIAIVKFGLGTYNGSTTFNANTHLTAGNHYCSVQQNQWTGEITGYSNYTTTFNNNYNVTEVLAGFTATASAGNVTNLKSAVQGLHEAGATAADMGMKLAYELVNRIGDDRSDSRKTVVFFTDGEPNHSSGYDTTVASDAITNSNNIKNISYTVPDPDHEGQTMTIHPTVFSVGLFAGDVDSRVNGFMTSVASGSDYYMDASGGSAEDLKKIFEAIAHSAGGTGNADLSGGTAVTVDVVSSSFTAPKNASDVQVLIAPCIGWQTIDGKQYLDFGEAKAPTEYGFTGIEVTVDEDNNMVSTSGFDFSENWCGPDPTSTSEIQPGFHGFQQILRFTITTNDDAVGGPAVETNDEESGIYLEGSDEPLLTFNRPTVKIPVQIWIQKTGLEGEDSAVFTLARSPFVENFDPTTASWESITKIVVGPDDLDPATGLYLKKQVGLDPDYYYRIKEDAWAFGYQYQYGGTLYTVGDEVQNPFTFENTPKNKKFDEASARNIFKERTATTPPAEEEEE